MSKSPSRSVSLLAVLMMPVLTGTSPLHPIATSQLGSPASQGELEYGARLDRDPRPGKAAKASAKAAAGSKAREQRRFPGVQVTPLPAGGVSIRPRGMGAASWAAAPEVFVDGLPVDVGPRGEIRSLDEEEIVRIEVERTSGATGVYGGTGVRPVIRITTDR
jgi:hypothetical protein